MRQFRDFDFDPELFKHSAHPVNNNHGHIVAIAIADKAKEIVGHGVYKTTDDTTYMQNLYIHPGHRKQGIASCFYDDLQCRYGKTLSCYTYEDGAEDAHIRMGFEKTSDPGYLIRKYDHSRCAECAKD